MQQENHHCDNVLKVYQYHMQKPEDMRWSNKENSGCVVASADGRVDEASADAFADLLSEGVERASTASSRKLIIDLQGLDYMSSRGLRALTIAKRQADEKKVEIILAAPNSIMQEILAISRYDKIFTVTKSVDEGF